MDSNHLSLIDPVEDATDLGVTGMLFALIVKFDFLSEGLFFLDLARPGASS